MNVLSGPSEFIILMGDPVEDISRNISSIPCKVLLLLFCAHFWKALLALSHHLEQSIPYMYETTFLFYFDDYTDENAHTRSSFYYFQNCILFCNLLTFFQNFYKGKKVLIS